METSELLTAIDQEISRLTLARNLLAGQNGATAVITRKRRVLSPEARERIADAQKKRWATQNRTAK